MVTLPLYYVDRATGAPVGHAQVHEIQEGLMRKSLFAVFAVVILAAALLTGCNPVSPAATAPAATTAPEAATAAPEAATDDLSGEITIAGSTTVQPLAELFAEKFMTTHPNVRIAVQGGGSSTGVKSAGDGTVNIGAASREIKDDELTTFPDLNVIVIARDGIAIVANADVTVDDLTIDQVRDIFSGAITNWNEVGGDDSAIVVISREEGSGTRAAFEEMVMGKDVLITDQAILQPSNGAIRSTVASTPSSVSFLSFGYLDDSVKTIAISGVQPTEEAAADGSYSIVRPLNMLTNGEPTGLTKAFLDYILSAEGQDLVAEEGYLRVN